MSPPEPEQGLVIDASLVPKSGKHTYGLDRFWNGSHSRTERGLDISTLAWLDLTGNCAYGLSVEQTPASVDASDPAATRMDVYLDQLRLMPWPVQGQMTYCDLRAIYEYLRAIPPHAGCVPPGVQGGLEIVRDMTADQL